MTAISAEPTGSASLAARSIAELVEQRAQATSAALFAVDEHRRVLTFADLRKEVLRTAAGLHELGIRRGDVVSWQLPNRFSTIVLSLALSRLGAVQNPLITLLREADLTFICGQAGSRHLFTAGTFRGTDHAATGAAVAAALPGLTAHVVDTGAEVEPITGALPQGDPAALPTAEDDGTEVRWLLYSSGTTSEPKGARHTDRGLLAASLTFCTNLRVRPEDQVATLLPLAHVGGIAHILTALQAGSSMVTSAIFDPDATIDLLSENRITLLGSGVPFIRAYLARQHTQSDTPLFPDVRATLCGGAGRPAALHEQVRDELGGVGIVSGYGMTECPYLTWGSPDDTDAEHATGEGRPGPGGEIRVVRADGSVAGPGEEGELRVRGPQLMLGYVDSTLDAAAFDEEGYFRTGDLGTVSENGTVTVTGRIKDIIIRKMENISAPEVEAHLLTHPAVADVAVIGLPDEESGERACAVVVPADPAAPPTLASLTAHLDERRFSTRKWPEQLELVTELPRNAMAKVLKRDLQARYAVRRPLGELTTITYTVDHQVAIVTLNRPERLNSFDRTMTEEIAQVWRSVRDDDDVHVIIVRAAGDRAFSTGLDLRQGPWWGDQNLWNQEDPGTLLGPRHHQVWKPVIAAVHGMTAGGGMYFLNEADIIICSEDATFFDPHANGGMVSALEPIGLLRRGVPLGDVLRWALTGNEERITAATALRLGLVTEIVPRAELWQAARALADEIAARRPQAVQGTVRAIWEALDQAPTQALRHGMSYAQLGNLGREALAPNSGGRKRLR